MAVICLFIMFLLYKLCSALFQMIRKMKLAEQQRREEAYKAMQRRQLAIEREQALQRKEAERIRKEQSRQAAQLAKNEKEIQDLYYKIDRAEDTINHYSSFLKALMSKRNAAQAEINDIVKKTSADIRKRYMEEHWNELQKKFGSAQVAESYSKVCGEVIGSNDKKAEKEKARLLKRKEVLENNVVKLDEKIYTAEQRIKKAKHDKYTAEQAILAK